jgi:hypothetical protein
MLRKCLKVATVARTATIAATCRSSLADLTRPRRLNLPTPAWAQHAPSAGWRDFSHTSRVYTDGDRVECTTEYAKTMPKTLREYPNDVLIMLTVQGEQQHDACRERMIRDIMTSDGISWEAAQPRIQVNTRARAVSVCYFLRRHFGRTCLRISKPVCSVVNV